MIKNKFEVSFTTEAQSEKGEISELFENPFSSTSLNFLN